MGQLRRLATHMELVVAALIAALFILGLVLARGIERVPGPVGATVGVPEHERHARVPGDHGVEP